MVKRFTARFARKLQTYKGTVRLLRLLPFLFLVAVGIINIVNYVQGAPWYSTVLNGRMLVGWLLATGLIYWLTRKGE